MLKKWCAAVILVFFIMSLPVSAQDGPDLSQTITGEDGVSFNYPDGWFAQSDAFGDIFIANERTVLEEGGIALLEGEGGVLAAETVFIWAVSQPIVAELFSQLNIATAEGLSPQAILEAVMLQEEDASVFSEAQTLTLGDYPAASLIFSAPELIVDAAVFIIQVDSDTYQIVYAFTGVGGYAQAEETVLAILNSIQYAAPLEGVAQTYISKLNTITFVYPDGWSVLEINEGAIYATNDTSSFSTSGIEGVIAINISEPAILNSQPSAGISSLEDRAAAQLAAETIIGEPQTVTIGPHTALRTDYLDEETEGFALQFEDIPLNIFVKAFPGELATFEPDVLALIETIQYTPPLDNYAVIWQVQHERDGAMTEGSELEVVTDLAIDDDDTIYIANGANGIVVMNADGNILRTISAGGAFIFAKDIIIAGDGTLWVADSQANQIHHLDADGNVLLSIGGEGDGPGQFTTFSPAEIAFDSAGNLYALDNGAFGATARIQIFDAAGLFQSEFSLPDLDFADYQTMALAPDDTIFVVSWEVGGLSTVHVYDREGNKLRQIDLNLDPDEFDGPIPAIIPLSDGGFFASNAFRSTIFHFDGEGNVLYSFGTRNEGLDTPFVRGAFSSALGDGLNGLGMLSNGNIIAGDYNQNYVQVVRVRIR